MLRFAAFGLACAVILYACLAPTEQLPSVSVWDKAEHALAWAALTGLGLALWPRRPWRVAAFTLGLGAAIEALQATMGLGRTGDLADLAADAVGVAAAVGLAALLGRRRRG
jgi:VanZ family protein